MKAMIFAAGLGTRLKPLTDRIPKALVEVGGVPLVALVIGRLKSFGYDDIVVNVHHFADMVEDYIHSMDDFGVKIRFSDERDCLLDTGGGILKARPLLEGEGHFLVHNVDILSDADLDAFARASGQDSIASLLVSRRKASRYLLFDKEMRMTGWMNASTGEIRGRKSDDGAGYAFSGIHMMSDSIFPLLSDYAAERKKAGLAACPEKFSITDFYIDSCGSEKISGYAPEGVRVMDVGKPDSLKLADDFVTGSL